MHSNLLTHITGWRGLGLVARAICRTKAGPTPCAGGQKSSPPGNQLCRNNDGLTQGQPAVIGRSGAVDQDRRVAKPPQACAQQARVLEPPARQYHCAGLSRVDQTTSRLRKGQTQPGLEPNRNTLSGRAARKIVADRRPDRIRVQQPFAQAKLVPPAGVPRVCMRQRFQPHGGLALVALPLGTNPKHRCHRIELAPGAGRQRRVQAFGRHLMQHRARGIREKLVGPTRQPRLIQPGKRIAPRVA